LIARLGARLFAATFGPDNAPEDMAKYVADAFSEERIARDLADPTAVFLLARADGDVVGYAHIRGGHTPDCVTGPRPAELVRIYVETARIGAGFGRTLMDACLEAARLRGYRTLWLGVWERNARAIRFYERCGFREVGSQPFVLGHDVQRDLILARAVPPSLDPAGSVSRG